LAQHGRGRAELEVRIQFPPAKNLLRTEPGGIGGPDGTPRSPKERGKLVVNTGLELKYNEGKF